TSRRMLIGAMRLRLKFCRFCFHMPLRRRARAVPGCHPTTGRYGYPAAASWRPTEPEALRQRLIKVRAHPDLPPMLAEDPFMRGWSNGYEFNLRLILIGNHHFCALFCQTDQLEKVGCCLFDRHNFR